MIEAAGWRMEERLLSRRDDVWVEDDRGERVYRVDHRALLIRGKTFQLAIDGAQAAASRKCAHRRINDAITAEYRDRTLPTVTRTRAGLHHHFEVHVPHAADLLVHGNVARYEYELRRDETPDGTVSSAVPGPHSYGTMSRRVRTNRLRSW